MHVDNRMVNHHHHHHITSQDAVRFSGTLSKERVADGGPKVIRTGICGMHTKVHCWTCCVLW